MAYIGDFAEDYATLNTKFTTVGSDGASTVLAGSPVISVYKANGLVRDLEKIMDTSDEALAEQGLNRQDAPRQAAANRGYF